MHEVYAVYMGRLATKESILSEARELFRASGADGVTMRAVAARVGVTPMAIYRHFDSWDELLEAVIERGHATFLGYLQRALAEPSPAARLFRAGQEYLNFALEHPRDYAAMFMVPRGSGSQQRRPHWRDVATFRFLVDRLRECAAAGLLEVDDPETAAFSVWAHVHGLVSLHLAERLGLDEAAFRSRYERSMTDLLYAFRWHGQPRSKAAGGRR
jgi:AcrR family transcriptional regulator